MERDPDMAWAGHDGRPAAIKNFAAYSLRRLGTDRIDIYRPAGLDPEVPIEDTIGAIAELVQAGHVRHIGLSEVGVDTIRRAHAIHPISDLQQIAIAWVLSRGADIVPLVGARRRDRLEEALGALPTSLADEDLAAIEAAVPKGTASGALYPEATLAHMDSERS